MTKTLKQMLRDGEPIHGTMLSEVPLPNVVHMLYACGFQFLIVDCEHGYFDFSQVGGIQAAAKGLDLPVVIRLPDNNRAGIIKYLDMGAQGLLLPMTSTPEDIRLVAEMSKYPPKGKRGVSTTRPHNSYNGADFGAYMERANGCTTVFAQIETRAALARLDEILAVEGVDGVFIGPNDLSVDLGVWGQPESPLMQDAIQRVAHSCEKVGKVWGIITSNVSMIQQWQTRGMRISSCNSEVGMMLKGGREIISKLQGISGESNKRKQ